MAPDDATAQRDVRVSVRLTEADAEWVTSLTQRAAELPGPGTGLRLAASVLQAGWRADLNATGTWTPPELLLLAEATNGTVFDPRMHGRLLAWEVRDMTTGVENHYVQHCGFESAADIDTLINRLEALSPGQDVALRDALSRWWAADNPRSFADVGLRVLPEQ